MTGHRKLNADEAPSSSRLAVHSRAYDVAQCRSRCAARRPRDLKTSPTTGRDSKRGPTFPPESHIPSSNAPERPPLSAILSSHDFELAASHTLSPKTWAFISSAATDNISHLHLNPSVFSRILLRPRILRNVRQCELQTKILGLPTAAPFFIAPTSMQGVVHPLGECELTRGAGAQGLVHCVSTSSSFPLEEILAGAIPGQHHFLQLYVNKERERTVELLRRAHEIGVKAVVVTVDAPVIGKREADERVLAEAPVKAGALEVSMSDHRGGGLGRLVGQYIDAGVVWADLEWIQRESRGLPLVLKGIQNAADAKIAANLGVQGIYLSNHGGRSVDTSPPGLLTLLEIHKTCPEILGQLEIYLDGGVQRGTDIFKALCLGATAVGIGRPYLYALDYGAQGVEHLSEILKDELETTMRMCGATKVDELHPGLVNTGDVEQLVPGNEAHEWIAWRRQNQSKL